MKKTLLTFNLLFFTFLLFSQVNITYNNAHNTISSNINALPNGNYIFCQYYLSNVKLTTVNENGEKQDSLVFDKINHSYTPAAENSIEIKDSNIYLLLKETDYEDTTKYFFSLTCFNLNLDTIWNKKYFVDTTQIIANAFCKTNDGGFAIAGTIDKGELKPDVFCLKIDSLGNQQWYNEYGYNNVNDYASNITETQDNEFIISGFSGRYSVYYDWYIIRTDSLGNKIWDWVLHNPLNVDEMGMSDLIQTQDGNFVAVGSKAYMLMRGGGLYKSRLLKFDINKNIILDTLYSEEADIGGHPEIDPFQYWSYFGNIQELDNGNFIVLNHKKIPTFNKYNSNIYILDSNFRLIRKVNFDSIAWGIAHERIRDFVVEPDGSLTMIGDISSDYNNPFSSPTQRVWFIKTDTDYCDGFGSCVRCEKS